MYKRDEEAKGNFPMLKGEGKNKLRREGIKKTGREGRGTEKE